MSTIAGTFNETTLLNQRVLADKIGFDERQKVDYIPQIEALHFVRDLETAKVLNTTSRKKDVDVDIMWDHVCGQVVQDETSCDRSGTKSSTGLQSYGITWAKEVNFSEAESDYRTNEFDINLAVAKQLLTAEKNLLEAFAQYVVGQLATFKGANAYAPVGGKGTVIGSDTYIPAHYWDASLVAYLVKCGLINKFSTPHFLSGENLFEPFYLAAANAANANGKGEQNLFSQMRMRFDLFNMDSVNDPDKITYMVQRGTLVLANKAINPDMPEQTMTFTRMTRKSTMFPGFTMDVYYDNACEAGNTIVHNYKVVLRADIFQNPLGCSATNTGTLAFICGNPPVQGN